MSGPSQIVESITVKVGAYYWQQVILGAGLEHLLQKRDVKAVSLKNIFELCVVGNDLRAKCFMVKVCRQGGG